MKKLVFIIPYFGRFNNYFQLFLNSCAQNIDIDWIIFTDDKRDFIYSSNIKVIYISFYEMKNFINKKMGFKVAMSKAYKLCDLKPAYGYLFEEYIKGYKAWGHCDTDLLFGKISNFVTEEDLRIYDKIGILGHCTIYRNTEKINRMFKMPLNGIKRYEEVFKSRRGYSFDEEFNSSINNIFEQEKLKIRYTEYEANIYTKSSDFRLTFMSNDKKSYEIEKNKKAFFIWDNGYLYRYIYNNKNLTRKEYFYIHMQARPMKIRLSDINCRRYKIIPNSFDDMETTDINEKNFDNIKRKYFNLHYFKLRGKNLYVKIKRRLNGYYNS